MLTIESEMFPEEKFAFPVSRRRPRFHQVHVHQPVGNLTMFPCCLLDFQRIDQFDGGEESDALQMMLDRLHRQGGRQKGLAGARPADEHQGVRLAQKLATVQLVDQRCLVNWARFRAHQFMKGSVEIILLRFYWNGRPPFLGSSLARNRSSRSNAMGTIVENRHLAGPSELADLEQIDLSEKAYAAAISDAMGNCGLLCRGEWRGAA